MKMIYILYVRLMYGFCKKKKKKKKETEKRDATVLLNRYVHVIYKILKYR